MRRRRPATCRLGLLVVTCGLLGVAAVPGAQGRTAEGSGPEVAPYLDVAGPNQDNLLAAVHAGLHDVTAAFVIGKGCTPIWDDGVPVARDHRVARLIRHAQHAGTGVVISFGGAAGKDLARTCLTTAALVPAYMQVIRQVDPTGIDLDIEGAAIRPRKEHESILRRFEAIRRVEQKHRGLTVSVTVPVGPRGLAARGVKLLRVAEQTKTRIDIVNLMTMDYGEPNDHMAATAMRAAKRSLAQVQGIWPDSSYANIGITSMIGDNDSADETFTLSDAAEVAGFAQDVGLGRLAFWSLNRDQPCQGATWASAGDDCSGIAQDRLDFTRLFLAS